MVNSSSNSHYYTWLLSPMILLQQLETQLDVYKKTISAVVNASCINCLTLITTCFRLSWSFPCKLHWEKLELWRLVPLLWWLHNLESSSVMVLWYCVAVFLTDNYKCKNIWSQYLMWLQEFMFITHSNYCSCIVESIETRILMIVYTGNWSCYGQGLSIPND